VERDEPPPEVRAILAEVLSPRLFRRWLEQQTQPHEGMDYRHTYCRMALAETGIELAPDWWVVHA
jgi:hypothetical protein